MFRTAGFSSRTALVATTIVIVLAVASAAASVSAPAARSFPTGVNARGRPAEARHLADAVARTHGRWSPSPVARALDVIGTHGSSGYAHLEHAVGGEAVGATLAPAWHAAGITGKGVRVAIIDGGFTGLAERQAAGDLPSPRLGRRRRHRKHVRLAGRR